MWWCSKHVHSKGEFNGLYMPHQEKDHHIWAAEKKKKKKPESYTKANAVRKTAKGIKSTTEGNNSKSTTQKSPFTISDRLKAAFAQRDSSPLINLTGFVRTVRIFNRPGSGIVRDG